MSYKTIDGNVRSQACICGESMVKAQDMRYNQETGIKTTYFYYLCPNCNRRVEQGKHYACTDRR